jgi:hypothetical protein
MLFETCQILANELNTYFSDDPVSIGNIANYSQDVSSNTSTGQILLTILNLKEITSLKNIPNYSIENQKVKYKNPKINLDIYLLCSVTQSAYDEALKKLGKIIEFFQGKNMFNQDNTPFEREGDLSDVGDFCFTVDLFTPTFEQLNYIWGTLGGKQYPAVIYKVSLLQIDRARITGDGNIITTIDKVFKKTS